MVVYLKPNFVALNTIMKEIKAFRLVALFEGISLIMLLFLAMPLKYMAGKPEMVQIVGMAHGLLFVAYAAFGLYLTIERKWGFTYGLKLFLASLFPFGTFIMDKSLRQKMEAAA